jgi:hypothetical protein
MERRDLLKGLSAAGFLSLLDPAYLAARESLQSGKTPTQPVPRRSYGRAKDQISVIVTTQKLSACFERMQSATRRVADPHVSFEGALLKPFCSLSCSLGRL